MSEYVYPANIWDRPKQLLATLGSFWNDVYAASDQVYSYGLAKCQVEQQTALDTLELIASLSRYTVPLWHRDNWYLLTLRESSRDTAEVSLTRYDDAGAEYDQGLKYDVPPRLPYFSYPLPPNMVGAPLIMNRFTEPSLVWTSGQDFEVTDRALVFRVDPFTDARVPIRDSYDGDGNIVDREASLWIFRGEFDWQLAYRQFGYAIGMRMRSSAGYRDIVNAVYDALTGGTTRRQIETAIAVMAGIPLVIEPSETVVDISLDQTHRLVLTDKHVYKFDLAATVLVAVGDTVHAGDSLTDALRIHEFNRGITPADLPALSLGRGFLATCFYGSLVFENKSVPLEVITNDPSGFTKLKFSLGGWPADVEQFFDEMHARGVAAAQAPVDPCAPGDATTRLGDECAGVGDTLMRRATLAHLLDIRPNPTSEPTAASLPTTINPLEFLITNVLRNNASLIRVKIAQQGDLALGLQHFRLLRKIIPPATAVILLVEMTLPEESVTVDLVNDDGMALLRGTLLDEEVVPSGLVGDTGMIARTALGTCT